MMEKITTSTKECKMLFGPPFASAESGHLGHLTNLILKDIILSVNKSMGRYVTGTDIRFDVHGLPVEQKVQEIINEKYGYNDTQTIIDKLGLKKYNDMCKEFVNNVINKWPLGFTEICPTLTCKGKSTMDLEYMKNLWFIFKTLYQRNLIYQGNKVQPYSAELETCMSNFESKQNYKSVSERSIYITFPFESKINDLNGEPIVKDINLIVWTTTPYTLFSNTVICISDKIMYRMFRSNEKWYICSNYFFNNTILKDKLIKIESTFEVKPDDLKGGRYIPIFDINPNKKYKIIWDDYVKEDSGTGLVHQSPAHGSEDFDTCLKHNIIDKTGEGCFDPMDSKMFFTEDVTDIYPNLANREARTCNSDIIKIIKENNRLFSEKNITHELPHCWRTDKPLYFKIVQTINIDIQKIKPDIMNNFETINFPYGVGKERMRENIRSAPDWCISRSRLWGTPIPLWENQDGDILVLDYNDLEIQTGQKFSDLHTDKIPKIITKNGKIYYHCNAVMDCWLESGSQFIAQKYSDEGSIFDFILEGMDQTRGWFYTLLVLGTALMNKSPYKNVIINGILLDKNGVKFSKRLKNYKNISELISEYGIDAVRLYLLASPATKGESFKFNDKNIGDWTRQVTIPLSNTLILFTEYINLYRKETDRNITCKDLELNVNKLSDMDIWIIVKFRYFIHNIIRQVDEYKLYKLGNYIKDFVHNLNNGYCKFNRNEIKGKSDIDRWRTSLIVLFYILHNTSIVLHNIIPVIADKINKTLNLLNIYDQEISLNTSGITDISIIKIEDNISNRTEIVDQIFNQIYTVLTWRGINNLSCKYPLRKIIFGLQNENMYYIERLQKYNEKICEEVNVLDIAYHNTDDFSTTVLKPNIKTIGRDFKNYRKDITDIISCKDFKDKHLTEINDNGYYHSSLGKITYEHFTIETIYSDMEGYDQFRDGNITIYIHKERSNELEELYTMKQIATKIQRYRKEVGIKVIDSLDIRWIASSNIDISIRKHLKYIENILGKSFTSLEGNDITFKSKCQYKSLDIKFEDEIVSIYIYKIE